MVYADGQLVNGNLVDYRVPRVGDLPERMESIMVENGDGPGPFGAKGIGEGATCAVATAVAAAVNQATGLELRDLPLHPEAVWRALRARPAELEQRGTR
jgi:CO/xanthine dehydrogenase Mo-binding subunit